MGILDGKRVLIIGASGGIGTSCVNECLAEGARVCGTFRRDAERTEKLAASYCGSFTGVRLDLLETDGIAAKIKSAVRDMNGIDVLINAAGTACPELIFSVELNNWEKIISCNLTAAFLIMQSVIVPMMSNGGSIINISSVFGFKGGVGQVSYCASKAGIIGMTKAAAIELASKNIRANVVAPGYIETAMTEDFDEEHHKKCIDKIPMKRFGTPDEVAELCVFLASDKSKYITGQIFVIDGGMSV